MRIFAANQMPQQPDRNSTGPAISVREQKVLSQTPLHLRCSDSISLCEELLQELRRLAANTPEEDMKELVKRGVGRPENLMRKGHCYLRKVLSNDPQQMIGPGGKPGFVHLPQATVKGGE